MPPSATRLYKIWQDMKRRCDNDTFAKFRLYGGRGITYAAEWQQYAPFEEWAYSHGYREYLTIDRINPNGDYTPSNCRWATYAEQNNNKRTNHLFTRNGETHNISEWAKIWQMSQSGARKRISKTEFDTFMKGVHA